MSNTELPRLAKGTVTVRVVIPLEEARAWGARLDEGQLLPATVEELERAKTGLVDKARAARPQGVVTPAPWGTVVLWSSHDRGVGLYWQG